MIRLLQLAIPALTVAAISAGFSAAHAAGKGGFSSHGKYSVRGTATLTPGGKLTLSGFKSSRGPDLYVYVGNGSPSRRIAKLKRFSGTQTYSVPASIARKATTVHIYCKRFSVKFGTARLR